MDQYLVPGDEHPELENHLQKVFFGRPDDGWLKWMHARIPSGASRRQSALHVFDLLTSYRPLAPQRLVKFIKANLCLAWLKQKFEPRIIYLTRHPCAVLAS